MVSEDASFASEKDFKEKIKQRLLSHIGKKIIPTGDEVLTEEHCQAILEIIAEHSFELYKFIEE